MPGRALRNDRRFAPHPNQPVKRRKPKRAEPSARAATQSYPHNRAAPSPRSPLRKKTSATSSAAAFAVKSGEFIRKWYRRAQRDGDSALCRKLTRKECGGEAEGFRKPSTELWIRKVMPVGYAVGDQLPECGPDYRELTFNSPGAGRPSLWTDDSRAALRRYLLTRPKKGADDGSWPSCRRLAMSRRLQDDIGVPHVTEQTYARIAGEEGLLWRKRYRRAYLDVGHKKRRKAFAEKYKDKPKSWWRGVAFQDEGHIDDWITGPKYCWQDINQPVETAPECKAKGPKLNFSVLVCHSNPNGRNGPNQTPKPDLFLYWTNLDTGMFQSIMHLQMKPFFDKNPHIHSIVMDGDKTHPGKNANQSNNNNALFKELFPTMNILGGPNLWRNDGTERAQSDSVLTNHKCRNMPQGESWIAMSPDINIAEHCVGGIVDCTRWGPTGSRTREMMTEGVNTRWRDYKQSSINKAVDSMPERMKAMYEVEGDYLLAGFQY